MLKLLTAGESHGPALNLILDGFPRGLPVDMQALQNDLLQRRSGFGRSGRMKIEKDQFEIMAGIRQGKTTGNPISITIANCDYANWKNETSPYANNNASANIELTQPRPGHVDLAAAQKYLTPDARDAVERASARSSVPYVLAGSFAKQLLSHFQMDVLGYVAGIGEIEAPIEIMELPLMRKSVQSSPLRCPNSKATEKMLEEIQKVRKKGDTLGGFIEIRAQHICPGLGSFSQWNQKIDSRLAAAIMGIPGIKGVEIGDGFKLASKSGSAVHDKILYSENEKKIKRSSNHAGGVEGGLTNGQDIFIRAAMKPIPTLGKPLPSIDLKTHNETKANTMRGDACAVPACAIICESMIALVLAETFLERFQGATLKEVKERYLTFQMNLRDL